MLVVTMEVNAPEWNAQGIKEQLAMVCEQFGDTRVVSVEAARGQQLNLWAARQGYQQTAPRNAPR